ncbi:hypothetical protein [Streptomyces sp. NPDC002516]
MSTDIAVDDRCIGAFWELKSKRDINAVIYRLNDLLNSCVVEHEGNLTHDELLLALPANEPRIVIYDLPFATEDGTRQNKILLISWLPPRATPQHKAAYGHAHAALRDTLDSSQLLPVRSTSTADLAYQCLASHARTAAHLGTQRTHHIRGTSQNAGQRPRPRAIKAIRMRHHRRDRCAAHHGAASTDV